MAIAANDTKRGYVSVVIPRFVTIPFKNQDGQVIASIKAGFTEYFPNLSPGEARAVVNAAAGWLDKNGTGQRTYSAGDNTIRLTDPSLSGINSSNYWDKIFSVSGLSEVGLNNREEVLANPPRSTTPSTPQPDPARPEPNPQLQPLPKPLPLGEDLQEIGRTYDVSPADIAREQENNPGMSAEAAAQRIKGRALFGGGTGSSTATPPGGGGTRPGSTTAAAGDDPIPDAVNRIRNANPSDVVEFVNGLTPQELQGLPAQIKSALLINIQAAESLNIKVPGLNNAKNTLSNQGNIPVPGSYPFSPDYIYPNPIFNTYPSFADPASPSFTGSGFGFTNLDLTPPGPLAQTPTPHQLTRNYETTQNADGTLSLRSVDPQPTNVTATQPQFPPLGTSIPGPETESVVRVGASVTFSVSLPSIANPTGNGQIPLAPLGSVSGKITVWSQRNAAGIANNSDDIQILKGEAQRVVKAEAATSAIASALALVQESDLSAVQSALSNAQPQTRNIVVDAWQAYRNALSEPGGTTPKAIKALMDTVGNAFPDVGVRFETPTLKPTISEAASGPTITNVLARLGLDLSKTVIPDGVSIGVNTYGEIKLEQNVASGAIKFDPATKQYSLNVALGGDGNYYLLNPLAATSGARTAAGTTLTGTDAAGSTALSQSVEHSGLIQTDRPLSLELVDKINARLNDQSSYQYWSHVGSTNTNTHVNFPTIPSAQFLNRYNAMVMPDGADSFLSLISNPSSANAFQEPPSTYNTIGGAPSFLKLALPPGTLKASIQGGIFGQIITRPVGPSGFDIGALNNATFGLQPKPLNANNLVSADTSISGIGKFVLDSRFAGGFRVEPMANTNRLSGVNIQALDGSVISVPKALVKAISGEALSQSEITTVTLWFFDNSSDNTLRKAFENAAVAGSPLSKEAASELLNSIRLILTTHGNDSIQNSGNKSLDKDTFVSKPTSFTLANDETSPFAAFHDPNYLTGYTSEQLSSVFKNYDELQKALASGTIGFVDVPAGLFDPLGSGSSTEEPLTISLDKPIIDEPLAISLDQPIIDIPVVDVPRTTPFDQQLAKVLGDAGTYLGWIQSLISKIDPKVGAEIGKAVALANAGNIVLSALSSDPNISSGKLDDAAFALFNAAAAFSPEIAKLSPYVNTAKQALDLFVALTTPQAIVQLGGQNFINAGGGKFFAQNVAGFGVAGSIAALGGSIAGLLHAPQEVVDILNGASILFQGISLIGAVGATVPIIGWSVSVVAFIFGLLTRNQEHWSKWQTLMQNVSVEGGQNPITGEVLQDDIVSQQTSDKQRNRVRYDGQAAQAPVLDARFTLRPETVLQNDPNGRFRIVTMSQLDSDGADQGLTPDLRNANRITVAGPDGQSYTLVARGQDENSGERIWSGSDGQDGWIRVTESQLAPQIEVANGNYILDLAVGFHAINPDVTAVQKTQNFTISADQAAKLRGDFGGDAGYAPFTDTRIADFRPWIDQMGSVRWETDHTTPNVYTYDDFNHDGVPDLMRQGILQKLRVAADGKYEVFLNEHFGARMFSYTANSEAEAYAVGARANVLSLYLASHPELYDLYFSQPQNSAAGNLTLIYELARDNGVLPKLDQLLALSGSPQGNTLQELLMDMANRGAQIAQLKQELGISVDPARLDQYPDLAAAFNHNTLQLLNHYIAHGNAEGRAVNDAGLVLSKWQPPSTGWSDLTALAYSASYPDLMNAFGTNADAARAHWNNNGRWEQRGISFNVDSYLSSRPDVRAAAIASLTVQPQTMIRYDGDGNAYELQYYDLRIDGYESPLGFVKQEPNRYSEDYYAGTSEPVWVASDPNLPPDDGYRGGIVTLTQAQLTAKAVPSEDAIQLFGVRHYVTNGRFEAAGIPAQAQALATPAPVAPTPATPAPAPSAAQLQSRGWSDLTALVYIASYVDLMNAFGTNAQAGRDHFSASGFGEQRGISFDVNSYLASRPDVRAAAIAALSTPGVSVSQQDTGDGYLSYLDVPNPNGGTARLYARGRDDNSGEAIYGGSDGNDGYISMTQSQINALATPVPPSEAEIQLFGVQHYITYGRLEMKQAA